MEDLWAFNNESLARAIYASRIPVISAVGHETDFTICDFVADRRAPTPSAAAEIAVPDTLELTRKINNITGRMELLLSKNIERKKMHLKMLSESRVMINPLNMLDEKKAILLSEIIRLEAAIKGNTVAKKNRFIELSSMLSALNPLSVLSRGFSAVFDKEGSLIKSAAAVKPGDELSLRLKDGEIRTTVKEIEIFDGEDNE